MNHMDTKRSDALCSRGIIVLFGPGVSRGHSPLLLLELLLKLGELFHGNFFFLVQHLMNTLNLFDL